MDTFRSAVPIYTALTILAVPHVLKAIRWRLQVEAVAYRLRRLERLLEAGVRQEAQRIMAAVTRDCGCGSGQPAENGLVAVPLRVRCPGSNT